MCIAWQLGKVSTRKLLRVHPWLCLPEIRWVSMPQQGPRRCATCGQVPLKTAPPRLPHAATSDTCHSCVGPLHAPSFSTPALQRGTSTGAQYSSAPSQVTDADVLRKGGECTPSAAACHLPLHTSPWGSSPSSPLSPFLRLPTPPPISPPRAPAPAPECTPSQAQVFPFPPLPPAARLMHAYR